MGETTEGEWLEGRLEDGWVSPAQWSVRSGGPTIFTLPRGYRPLERPRHYLVIYPVRHPAQSPWERDWEIEHDPSCPAVWRSVSYATSSLSVTYRCEMADHVGYHGIDHLETGTSAEWSGLPPGRYEIELAKSYVAGVYGGEGEWDVWLRVVRRVPQIATVVSV